MAKGQSLQDPFLNALRKERVPVSIYLVNGIKLQGQIDSFDQFVVLLKNSVSQMVYKHAISTVVPARNVRLTAEEGAAPAESDRFVRSVRGAVEEQRQPDGLQARHFHRRAGAQCASDCGGGSCARGVARRVMRRPTEVPSVRAPALR